MSKFYADVVVNVPQVGQIFNYEIPAHLVGQIHQGSLVFVPFQSQKVSGVVSSVLSHARYPTPKMIESVLNHDIRLTDGQIELMQWIADETMCSISDCISLMLPAGILKETDKLYHLNVEQTSNASLTKLQMRMIRLLREKGDMRGRQIDCAIPKTNWRASMSILVQRGLVTAQSVLPKPQVKSKQSKFVEKTIPLDIALSIVDNTVRIQDKTKERRKEILIFLDAEEAPIEQRNLTSQFVSTSKELATMSSQGLLRIFKKELDRSLVFDLPYDPSEEFNLTPNQDAAWGVIQQAMRSEKSQNPFLLHGVTGSGKTEVYLRAVGEALQQGKQAIVLVPEIALTPQTIQRFHGRFQNQVGLIHSRLSLGERYDTWRKAREGEISVIVGPRSALFTPFENIGLIVMDECHDPSYYQSGILPYYHARDVAIHLAEKTQSTLILGSATPSVETYYTALTGEIDLLELPQRIMAHKNVVNDYPEQEALIATQDGDLDTDTVSQPLPPVEVIDMREEIKQNNRSIFSDILKQRLEDVLHKNQQAILYLNRRGSATYVFCRDCGHVLRCRNDETAYTYHEKQNKLICHTCSSVRNYPKTCPECGSARIKHYGLGTQQVEEETQKLFPEARLLRWDRDTTKCKGSHQEILDQFANYEADILIGTQMLAKGLDLPLVTLVGAVLADVGMSLPDFRANERTFQLLSQVSGRAGRSLLGGNVILQTFRPESYILRTAAEHDYAGFYKQEIVFRKKIGYPPFSKLMRLEYRHTDPRAGEAVVNATVQRLKNYAASKGYSSTSVSEGTPCYFRKIDLEWRWQILIRGHQARDVVMNVALPDWRIETAPQSLL